MAYLDDAPSHSVSYDKGYLFTSDQAGDAIGQFGQAAGGASKTLVGLAFANKKRRLEKQKKAIEQRLRKAQFDEAELGTLEDESATFREYDRQMPGVLSDISARGGAESSHRKEVENYEKFQRDLRVNAIRRRRALLRHGHEAGEKIRALQERWEKLDRTEAMIGAAIDTVISVASIASDRRLKADLAHVSDVEMLTGIECLPISTWRYKTDSEDVRHIGPMAQDFYDVFGMGQSRERIQVVDGIGVALACIKALAREVRTLRTQVERLRK